CSTVVLNHIIIELLAGEVTKHAGEVASLVTKEAGPRTRVHLARNGLEPTERFIERGYKKTGISFVQAHRRRDTDGLAVQAAFAKQQAELLGGFQHLSTFTGGRLFRVAIFYQLDAEKEAPAAGFANNLVFSHE